MIVVCLFLCMYLIMLQSSCGHVVRDFESEAKKLGITFNSAKLGGIDFQKVQTDHVCKV